MTSISSAVHQRFSRLAQGISAAAGNVYAFAGAVLVIAVWALIGPLFDYSDTWQLCVNTGTTIITFLMVFLIQHAQSHDTRAIQIKLDELISAIGGASNQMIEAENLSEAQIEALYRRYQRVARASQSRTADSK